MYFQIFIVLTISSLWMFLLKHLLKLDNRLIFYGVLYGFIAYSGLFLSFFVFPLMYMFFDVIGIVVIFEEIAKLLPCMYLIREIDNQKNKYLGYGALTGLGFSLFENISYLGSPSSVLSRSILATGFHMITTSLSVYGLYRDKNYRRNIWIIYLLFSSCLHLTYNWIIFRYW